MNLRVVSQGSLYTLAVEPDLVGTIKTMQGFDSEVYKIKQDLKEGSPSSFTIADDGALYFKGCHIPSFWHCSRLTSCVHHVYIFET